MKTKLFSEAIRELMDKRAITIEYADDFIKRCVKLTKEFQELTDMFVTAVHEGLDKIDKSELSKDQALMLSSEIRLLIVRTVIDNFADMNYRPDKPDGWDGPT